MTTAVLRLYAPALVLLLWAVLAAVGVDCPEALVVALSLSAAVHVFERVHDERLRR